MHGSTALVNDIAAAHRITQIIGSAELEKSFGMLANAPEGTPADQIRAAGARIGQGIQMPGFIKLIAQVLHLDFGDSTDESGTDTDESGDNQ